MSKQLGIQMDRAMTGSAATGSPLAVELGLHPAVPPELLSRVTPLQTRLREYLQSSYVGLFRELTGLELDFVWAPPLPLPACDGPSLITTLAKAWRHPPGALLPSLPETVWRRHLAATLQAGLRGHKFTHPAGARHFWCPLAVRGLLLGCAQLQAQTDKPVQRGAVVAGRMSFDRSIALLRLVLHDAISSLLAEWPDSEVNPLLVAPPPASAPTAHRGVVLVQRMLERVHQDYAQPITLKSLAQDLAMNAAYLSDLFHRHTGISFKHYLIRRRLQKASELLRDPLCRISDVACAVGYPDPNQFRRIFKAWTGQPPRAAQNQADSEAARGDSRKAAAKLLPDFPK